MEEYEMSEQQSANQTVSKMEGGELVLARTFNAPRELVFKVWTEAEHLAQWWGPAGMELTVLKLDVRPGGIYHFGMKSPEGFEMFGKFVYYEIAAPEKLVYTNAFADAEGNTIRAPFFATPVFPLEIMNTLTLAEQDGQTMLTLRGAPYNATEEERQFFASMHESMHQGFSGTFDQLERHLAKV
jgi:uncharacterized protein YndB with AHSA1/START domain